MPDRKYLAKIHIMKKEKGILEEDYRGILSSKFKVQSSKSLTNYQALIFIRSLRDFHKDVYAPTDEMIWKIKTLWHEVYRGNFEHLHLRRFLFKHFKISDLKFLDRRKAYEAVEALKAMHGRKNES